MAPFVALLLAGCASSGGSAVDTADEGCGPPVGADPGPRRLDSAHLLVVPNGEGLHLVRVDGTLAFSAPWSELLGSCERCLGEGASADGDGLLVSVNVSAVGSVARLGRDATLDWRLDGFAFPHDAIRDPADGSVLVLESLEDRVTWIGCDGSSAAPARQMTADRTPGLEGRQPNGAERLDWDGRSLLLLSTRSAGAGWTGSISLWDITDTGPPTLVWRFPEAGGLATPHSPILRAWDGRWWMLWAHTDGARPEGSSVGVAVTDDPTVRPTYVADLLPPADAPPWGYARGVELTEDGVLIVTDTSADGWLGPNDLDGGVHQTWLPSLAPTGASGLPGEDQVFVRLETDETLIGGLSMPFEAWLWRPTFPLE